MTQLPERVIRKYYTSDDVQCHNRKEDCWVSFLGKVYDITPVVLSAEPRLVQTLVEAAGTDISHWFDPKTEDLRTWTDPLSDRVVYQLPRGKPLLDADTEAAPASADATPWWRDGRLCIGMLTARARPLYVINTLTGDRHLLRVPREDTLGDIVARYTEFNENAHAYEWRFLGRALDLGRTLEANGIADEADEFQEFEWGEEERYIPGVTIVFRDALL